MIFTSPLKLFSFSRYLRFCFEFLVMQNIGYGQKDKVNFKICNVTTWSKNNCNSHLIENHEECLTSNSFRYSLHKLPFHACQNHKDSYKSHLFPYCLYNHFLLLCLSIFIFCQIFLNCYSFIFPTVYCSNACQK